ncbi:MAG: hypothetical protein CM15mP87_01470 [Candidatus Neomarinimicrobiota bacterium]|nr:MAG: hypothetical protein CM15mP87_01470 [Candidatus Neomarinimicrobiota bacterium]
MLKWVGRLPGLTGCTRLCMEAHTATGHDKASLAFLRAEPANATTARSRRGAKSSGSAPNTSRRVTSRVIKSRVDQLNVTACLDRPVTAGSGKPFTMAHVIQTVQRPTIISFWHRTRRTPPRSFAW